MRHFVPWRGGNSFQIESFCDHVTMRQKLIGYTMPFELRPWAAPFACESDDQTTIGRAGLQPLALVIAGHE
jgi:hypothetical protein